MQINTKYSINDTVYPIRRTYSCGPRILCEDCEGRGTIILRSGKVIGCPICNRIGSIAPEAIEIWFPDYRNTGVIGKIIVEVEDDLDLGPVIETRYMLDSTGIGTGTLHKEEDLFPFGPVAYEECVKRNEKLCEEGEIPANWREVLSEKIG